MFWHMARSGASRTRHVSLLLLVVAAAASVVGGLSITPGADADGNSNPIGAYAGALSPGTVAHSVAPSASSRRSPWTSSTGAPGRRW